MIVTIACATEIIGSAMVSGTEFRLNCPPVWAVYKTSEQCTQTVHFLGR